MTSKTIKIHVMYPFCGGIVRLFKELDIIIGEIRPFFIEFILI